MVIVMKINKKMITPIIVVSGLLLTSCGSDFEGVSTSTATNSSPTAINSTGENQEPVEYKVDYDEEQEISVVATSFMDFLHSNKIEEEYSVDTRLSDEEKLTFLEDNYSNLNIYFDYEFLTMEEKIELYDNVYDLRETSTKYDIIRVDPLGITTNENDTGLATLSGEYIIGTLNGENTPIYVNKTYDFINTSSGWKLDHQQFIT